VAQIVVFNKIDRLAETERPRALGDVFSLPGGRRVPRVFVSARTGEGLGPLREQVAAAAMRGPAEPADLNGDAMASPQGIDDEPAAASSDEPGEDRRDGTYHSVA